jgi:predicted amidohydrolase
VVAVAQTGAVRGDVGANVAEAGRILARAAADGVGLVVVPECHLTGYMFDSRAEVEAVAVSLDSPPVRALEDDCRRLGLHAIVGLIERDGGNVHNAAVLLGPGGMIGVHRKRHLPFIGADRFIDEPEEYRLPVFDTALGRIGIAIGYEIRFPEMIRTLALAGAELVALPTNWPVQSELLARHFAPVRAAENFVYLLVANRPDREGGADFLGASQIVDPRGEVVVGADRETVLLTAEADLELARTKRIVFDEGVFEFSPWRDRRPALYRLAAGEHEALTGGAPARARR